VLGRRNQIGDLGLERLIDLRIVTHPALAGPFWAFTRNAGPSRPGALPGM
jgi:hypothetical protein